MGLDKRALVCGGACQLKSRGEAHVIRKWGQDKCSQIKTAGGRKGAVLAGGWGLTSGALTAGASRRKAAAPLLPPVNLAVIGSSARFQTDKRPFGKLECLGRQF